MKYRSSCNLLDSQAGLLHIVGMTGRKEDLMSKAFTFKNYQSKQLLVIAGPCMAESWELVDHVAAELKKHADEHDYKLVFKASFDKANRTSIHSERGPGLEKAGKWFADIRSKYELPVLTDVHETHQIGPVSETVDVLQIPAFLCRQTDLLAAAVSSGCAVNVKKGQFLAPENAEHIVRKAQEVAKESGVAENIAVTERGASFGYGDLVVDMRGFATMHSFGAPLIFDVTHSCQKPAAGSTTGGARAFAPTLARSAIATGYVDGIFLETHTDPSHAKSDAQVQLSLDQGKALIGQAVELWKQTRQATDIDRMF